MSTEQEETWWVKVITHSPSFFGGFFLGVLSGYCGNWLWDKFKPKRKDGHMTLEVTESGAHFTGKMDNTNSEQILKVMNAAATKPKNKQTGSLYTPPNQN